MLLYFLFYFHKSAVTIQSCGFILVQSRLSAASVCSPSWWQQGILGWGDTGPGNAATDYEAREVNFRRHKYSMRMEMGLLRVPDESGCKGLLQWRKRRECLAVRYRHMSLFGAVTSAYRLQIRYNNRLQRWWGGVTLSLPCTPFIAANTTRYWVLCWACAGVYLFRLHLQLCGTSGMQTGCRRATCNPSETYSGAKGSELPPVAKSLGVILKVKRL